ncbi:MAG: DDE-type integrase/transposase/recombinase, partial [Candidatus Subteraquimicrobiales bacterium]|nr:DDE-type integrase/transposase/recombinase [Candidatus Subteraquimicrobiales bacterium]
MKGIDNTLLAVALDEWLSAPHGAKEFVVNKHAERFKISFQTMHLKFKSFGYHLPQKKTKCTKGKSKIEGLREIAEAIARLYALIPKRAGRKPPLEYAIEKAIINGLVPGNTKDIHPGTIGRAMRELNLLDTKGRIYRFQAKRPMEQVQYDCSGSEYLYVSRFEGKEPILRIRESKSYKNKDKFENYRVWYHGIVDDHSRYWLAMPHVAPGEDSECAIKTLKWAFSKKEDQRIPFRGLPARLYMDNGPLAKANATKDFLKRIGVELKTHAPECPDGTGKIEIKWKELWRGFEVGEFLMQPHWEKQEISLTQLREMLMNYTVWLN